MYIVGRACLRYTNRCKRKKRAISIDPLIALAPGDDVIVLCCEAVKFGCLLRGLFFESFCSERLEAEKQDGEACRNEPKSRLLASSALNFFFRSSSSSECFFSDRPFPREAFAVCRGKREVSVSRKVQDRRTLFLSLPYSSCVWMRSSMM